MNKRPVKPTQKQKITELEKAIREHKKQLSSLKAKQERLLVEISLQKEFDKK